jgi:hypothetical protein
MARRQTCPRKWTHALCRHPARGSHGHRIQKREQSAHRPQRTTTTDAVSTGPTFRCNDTIQRHPKRPCANAPTFKKSPPCTMKSLMTRWNLLPLYPTGMPAGRYSPVHSCLQVSKHGRVVGGEGEDVGAGGGGFASRMDTWACLQVTDPQPERGLHAHPHTHTTGTPSTSQTRPTHLKFSTVCGSPGPRDGAEDDVATHPRTRTHTTSQQLATLPVTAPRVQAQGHIAPHSDQAATAQPQ